MPVPVPPLVLETNEDRRRHDAGRGRREQRLRERAAKADA
jgi:hypothetical protein